MTQGVDTPVNAMQPAHAHPVSNPVLVETHTTQLLDRDDTVLSSRDRRNLNVRVGALVVHIATKSPSAADSPPARLEMFATTVRERYLEGSSRTVGHHRDYSQA